MQLKRPNKLIFGNTLFDIKKTRQMILKNRSYAHTYHQILLAGADQQVSELSDTAGKSDSY